MFIQDKNFNFIEIEDKKISGITQDKFVVAFDFDGVVTNPHKLKTQYINELGYGITPEQCGRHVCIDILGIPIKDYERGTFRSYTESPDKLPLETDFKENFQKIRNLEKIALFFVTSRYDDMLQHLQEYTKYHKIKIGGVVNTENKPKTASLKSVNANIFVDDSPKKIWAIMSEDSKFCEKCSLILYRNIANKSEENPCPSRIIETDNWNNLADRIIKEYQKFFATFSKSSSGISR
ncbi:hypothetical protein A3K82_00405 [Candidatus Pacearchaeota archaeon RBG_19FT_COMBO_34_9]|nr:MAG: hypothetical protein A3K82_00405 [Candidatus Pacearchaeota archaeon RBG_19FT_COMBO_34_9]OGJ16227.1 MAG: hypothetical protein A3K74_03310 [Candidatus Pacearchaeota archaeon RBG_13_33_26]